MKCKIVVANELTLPPVYAGPRWETVTLSGTHQRIIRVKSVKSPYVYTGPRWETVCQ